MDIVFYIGIRFLARTVRILMVTPISLEFQCGPHLIYGLCRGGLTVGPPHFGDGPGPLLGTVVKWFGTHFVAAGLSHVVATP